MENKENFNYTYSAKEQAEIKRIREKYAPTPQVESKMDALRRLDKQVTSKATAAALTVGILGALILGTGMSLIMTEFGNLLGSFFTAVAVGLALGVAGVLLVCLAYPIYTRTLQKGQEKAAPEILRLTDELMK